MSVSDCLCQKCQTKSLTKKNSMEAAIVVHLWCCVKAVKNVGTFGCISSSCCEKAACSRCEIFGRFFKLLTAVAARTTQKQKRTLTLRNIKSVSPQVRECMSANWWCVRRPCVRIGLGSIPLHVPKTCAMFSQEARTVWFESLISFPSWTRNLRWWGQVSILFLYEYAFCIFFVHLVVRWGSR